MIVVDLVSDNPGARFAGCQRMATAIVDITRTKGGCLPLDLLARGFTTQETLQQWPLAHAMADVELRLMDAA